MTVRPTVSAVIPAYDAAEFVGRAIESVLGQTEPPIEVIVVDDGSSDNTSEVVAAYGASVRLVRQANAGPAAARNRGIRLATGDWIGLLDADDRWAADKLARQIELISDPKTATIATWNARRQERRPREFVDFETLWRSNRFVTSSALVRREAFEDVGGFDEDRELISVEDYNLWLRLALRGWKLLACPDRFCDYLPSPNNLTSQVERMAAAELANLCRIAADPKIDVDRVRAKRIAILEEYGRDLFYHRRLSAARKLFAAPLRERPSPTRLFWWLATYTPIPLLGLRRRAG